MTQVLGESKPSDLPNGFPLTPALSLQGRGR